MAASSLAPAIPTVVYDTFWQFAAERQAIFFRRLIGEPEPWTQDPILGSYRFTNVFRASDRVSQYLINEVIYQGANTDSEVFFRIVLFKLFNRIETWETMRTALGTPSYSTYSFEAYDGILSRMMENGTRVYSSAYIMPSGKSFFGHTRKHRNHLRLIELMMNDRVFDQIAKAETMREVFSLLRKYPSLGDFLAYQLTVDLNYSEIVDFSENEFVVAGPGAVDGIRKCFADTGGLSSSDLIRTVLDRQDDEFDARGIDFQNLWGRRLHLIDCQNLFCEVSKYARVKHPEIVGASNRTRIKQAFRPNKTALRYWFPPKWGINSAVAAWYSASAAPLQPPLWNEEIPDGTS